MSFLKTDEAWPQTVSPDDLQFDRFVEGLGLTKDYLDSEAVRITLHDGYTTIITDEPAWRRFLLEVVDRLAHDGESVRPIVKVVKPSLTTKDNPGSEDAVMRDAGPFSKPQPRVHFNTDPVLISSRLGIQGPPETSSNMPEDHPLGDVEFWHEWDEVCRFFHYSGMKDGEGVLLPRFSKSIVPVSIVKIYRALRDRHLGGGGGGNNDDVQFRLGDEEEIQLMGILARCWSTFTQCLEARHGETSYQGKVTATDVEESQGLMCCCRANCITMRVCQNTVRGPQIVLASDLSAVAAYVKAIDDVFGDPEMDADPCMTTMVYDAGRVTHEAPSTKRSVGKLGAGALVASVKGRCPDTVDLVDGMALADIRSRLSVQPVLAPLKMTTSGPSKVSYAQEQVILIVNCADFDAELFEHTFSTRAEFAKAGGRGRYRIHLTGAITAATVVGDKYVESKAVTERSVVRLLRNVCHPTKDMARGTLMSECLRAVTFGVGDEELA